MEQNTITPEMAEKILDADYRNIVKKVADGKPLTNAELSRIQARAAGAEESTVTLAKTTTELADILGVPRQTLNRWKKRAGAPQPKANGYHSVIEWREFVRMNHLRASDGAAFNEEMLRARKLLAEVEEREIKTSILKGEYMPAAEVESFFYAAVRKLYALEDQKLCNELPPVLCGLDAIAIRERMEKELYDIRKQIHEHAVGFFSQSRSAAQPDAGVAVV